MKTLALGWICITFLTICAIRATDAPTGQTELTWYADGEYTANGETFRPQAYTCAVRNRSRLDHWLRFEYNGKVVYCYANDMMPKDSKAEYDLTPAAFARLAPLRAGRIKGVAVRAVQ